MSAAAVAYLQRTWGKLTFAKVNRVIAREPEDVLMIQIPRIITTEDGLKLRDHNEYYVSSNRISDIPAADRWRADISWRHYFGFTDEGIYFQKDDFLGFDFDVSMSLTWSRWGNHSGGWNKPAIGSMIAGEVIDTPRGKRFRKWFICSPELQFFFDVVLSGTTMSEEELASKLMTGEFPDKYWAIARLVLFDNVQAFVDELKDIRPPHPHYGKEYTSEGYLGDKKPKVYWEGMFLPMNTAKYVHLLSHYLHEPKWWKEFFRLAAEQGLNQKHVKGGDVCEACEAERPLDDRLYSLSY